MRVDEDGRKRKVMEMYLVDAMSYTEAEARIIEEMELVVRGEYYIPSLKKSNINEVVSSEDENDDRWYKAKVAIVDADEVSGKEKRSFQYYLVAACDTNRALGNLEKALSTFVVPYEVASISDTLFMDVFPYFGDNTEDINSKKWPKMDRTIDFRELVHKMRKAQKQYFKSRDRRDLQKAKELEKEVDDFLSRHFQKAQGKTLFD